ncbi:MAG: chlorite dismutase family protein [Gemmatimonadaceae bacterium]
MPVETTQFVAGTRGEWRITRVDAVIGAPLPPSQRLAIGPSATRDDPSAAWVLRGVASYARYTTRPEQDALVAVQPPLGRADARCAALIPIAKSEAWWALPQDERRHILEQRSRHIATGITYLPAVARRLYQSRELGQPFDFLTWFEYAPESAARFEDLVGVLRETEEWRFVEREVDVRLVRDEEA